MTLKEVETFLKEKFYKVKEKEGYEWGRGSATTKEFFRDFAIPIHIILTNGIQHSVFVDKIIIGKYKNLGSCVLHKNISFYFLDDVRFKEDLDNIADMRYEGLSENSSKEIEINLNEVKKDLDEELRKENDIEKALEELYEKLIKPFMIRLVKDIKEEIKK